MINQSLNPSIAVVGAGTMGSGIAQKYAAHGYDVVLVDQNNENLKKSHSSILNLLKQGVERGIFKDLDAKNIIERITFTQDLKKCEHAILVIEAIFEDLSLKKELFLSLEALCSNQTLLATNTSSFKISDIQVGLKYPERVLGLHYFYHPAKNRLVEIIATPLTKKNILVQAQEIQNNINKIAIFSKDSPGFIVNRFFVPWLNEAMRIAQEGNANCATIDAAAKDFFKIGMGPFQLMNVTGLPITFHSCLSLAKTFGEFYAPCPMISTQIENKNTWNLEETIDSSQFEAISMRLLAVVGAICRQMVYEEDICAIADVDLGARVGLLWKQGPFELLNHSIEKSNTESH